MSPNLDFRAQANARFITSANKLAQFSNNRVNPKVIYQKIILILSRHNYYFMGTKSLFPVVDSLEEECSDISPLEASLQSTII